jgi:hypothetical protein
MVKGGIARYDGQNDWSLATTIRRINVSTAIDDGPYCVRVSGANCLL